MTLPYVFTVEGMVGFFAAAGTDPGPEVIEVASVRLGRNAYPALVAELWCEGLLTAEAAITVVPAAWSMAEFPLRALDEDTWRSLFALAGYTVDGVPAAQPTTPLRLYRGGADPAGWSWTDDVRMAEGFACRRQAQTGVACRVWVADVAPVRLLARIDKLTRAEAEYVVDTRGMHADVLADPADSLRTGEGV